MHSNLLILLHNTKCGMKDFFRNMFNGKENIYIKTYFNIHNTLNYESGNIYY